VVNELFSRVGYQVLFCNIGCMISTVNQYVIPGFILRRLRSGHLAIPLFCSLELGVHIIDQATVVKTLVFNLLADKKLNVQTFRS
jgi:hypothetical protein